ncbi:MAG: hypothetical protein K8R87_09140 [Verrucomicrobia bacterium]|nr:hypothetical protein [Verrucomicrobiota bacterium]
MAAPNARSEMNWTKEPNYPRPDYLSSSRTDHPNQTANYTLGIEKWNSS